MSGPLTRMPLSDDDPALRECNTLVTSTPTGWVAICLDCVGDDGGPHDLGEWTEQEEAHTAAAEHRVETRSPETCPTCGHSLPCPIPPPSGAQL